VQHGLPSCKAERCNTISCGQVKRGRRVVVPETTLPQGQRELSARHVPVAAAVISVVHTQAGGTNEGNTER